MNYSKLISLIDGKKITKAMVIKKTGISRPALDAILGGNDFKVSNLKKIANCLSVPVGYFFDEVTEVNEIRETGRDYAIKVNTELNGAETTNSLTSTESDLRDQIIAQLKSQLADKERIIRLLEASLNKNC